MGAAQHSKNKKKRPAKAPPQSVRAFADIMRAVENMGPIKRFFARMAAEAIINELRLYQPNRLRAYDSHIGESDFPWRDAEKSSEFWKVYQRMVIEGRPY